VRFPDQCFLEGAKNEKFEKDFNKFNKFVKIDWSNHAELDQKY